jgi:hypothetical protein
MKNLPLVFCNVVLLVALCSGEEQVAKCSFGSLTQCLTHPPGPIPSYWLPMLHHYECITSRAQGAKL